ncbi:hypothetical protein KFZ70_16055 [Tamlana fucoidanivorans]|uniref:Uncharacterized protein n=1 Tax=Allotamlana fucoidanivorans TaxID=2583814 RepID=A0A5C4SH36_9FLAO|nr:hypothetical protein [Tamlana fucoidanivorans]TNJ42945.1 hypothetical protein FGF67_13220 [Tamlana fucoidanivorans]
MNHKTFRVGVFVIAIIIFGVLFLFRNFNFFHFSPSEGHDYSNIEHNQKESCLACHQNTKGYSAYHNPKNIGCASCHLGNARSMDKEASHDGMVLIPGNLSDAEKTCGTCHQSELYKIENSLMTTNSGIVAVDKFVFGESNNLDAHYHIKDLKFSAADKHLRDLCANCHLGAQKSEFGEINQLSRGGGCNACHLNYSKEAKLGLDTYLSSNKTVLPTYHPATDIHVNDTHCFGCHSRSSRISTNYMGLQETLLEADAVVNNSDYQVLKDHRVYLKLEEDVHHTKGLLCIDCHSSHEVMGNGKLYAHEEQAVTLQCSDCHFQEKPKTTSYDDLDAESSLVFLHRHYTHTDAPILVAEKDGHPLVNTFVDALGHAYLIGKKDGTLHEIKPQSEVCARDVAHKNVSCSACHSSWTSRCIGCHNQFDADEQHAFDLLSKKYTKGQWKEYVAEFSSDLPALGVREDSDNHSIEPAVPGMILTIDKGSYTGMPEKEVSFHRLYAPNAPHTTTISVRNCESCHVNSAALGYGKGDLQYVMNETYGTWEFTAEYALNSNDSLPEDAWIPFMKAQNSKKPNSTRSDFRPFNLEEQKNILRVGACLQCHDYNSKVMKQSLRVGLSSMINKVSSSCVLPK